MRRLCCGALRYGWRASAGASVVDGFIARKLRCLSQNSVMARSAGSPVCRSPVVVST
jgi:hypothetical protein